MINTILVDDEIRSCEILEELLTMFNNEVNVVGKAHNVLDAINLINTKQPDLVFLDIQMPTGTGFEVLEKVKHKNFSVVFVTAYNEYAIKAFKYSATDYLLKPINIDELENSLSKIGNKQSSEDLEEKINFLVDNYEAIAGNSSKKKIILPTENKFQVFNLGTLIRCNSVGRQTEFHFVNGDKIIIAKSIRNFEDYLTESSFVKVNRSNIINVDFITSYVKGSGAMVVLSNGESIEISRNRRNPFLTKMNDRKVY